MDLMIDENEYLKERILRLHISKESDVCACGLRAGTAAHRPLKRHELVCGEILCDTATEDMTFIHSVSAFVRNRASIPISPTTKACEVCLHLHTDCKFTMYDLGIPSFISLQG